ncbi:permease [Prauserella marina]|uniref:Putative ABC transport system permease protein n=1 Tax=Prauserella marina TaxID=530584 RepID=A0A222VQJ3_9PSEU|nr:permease [Prauserella marina]ASR36206.1 permease [Prauserella marina]PWV76960.1 putative ABC transport system permease protein [Prauserella marina]SDD01187.1 putative ABC transport system permease protein [Prauserella marina]
MPKRRGFATTLATLPWRTAPRAGLSSPLTIVVAAVTALLTCFLAMAAVLHSSSAAGATVGHQTDKVCPDGYGPSFTKPRVEPAMVPVLTDTVGRHAAEHGFGKPIVSLFTGVTTLEFDGDTYRTRIAYRDGGTDQLRLMDGSAKPGLWMGRDLAHAKDIGVGTRGQQGALPPVTGIYEDLYNPAPREWCSVQDLAVQNRLVDTLTGSVLFATDRSTFDSITGDFESLERLSITFPEGPPGTLGEAKDRVDRSEALIAAVRADLEAQGIGDILPGAIPFERSMEIATQAQGNVLFSILPLAVLSVLVGCGGIATVGLQWYQRRHSQVRLVSSRGAGPAAIGLLAAFEVGLPIVLGGAAGMVTARALLPAYGPGGMIDPGAVWLGAGVGAGVLVASVVLLIGVVGFRAHREFQLGRIAPNRHGWRIVAFFPWEILTAGFAVLGWTRLAAYGGSSSSADPLPQVDPLALTYPVSVVLTVGLLASRIAWLALHASHRARFWSKPALQLAIRRLASARAPVTGVLVIGVLAVGTLAVGTSIATGQRQSLEVKSATLVGANSRMNTETPVGLGAKALPADVRDTSTVAGKLTGTGSVVLVVDPATFENAVSTASTASAIDREELRGLLSRLDGASAGTIPALRVGHTDSQSAELPGLPDAMPVADLGVFPLIGAEPGYVISRQSLTQEQLDAIPEWIVLSASPLPVLTAAFNHAGLSHANGVSTDTALDALPFYVVGWTFSFVTVLGAVLGVVAVLALLVAVETRRRQNALAGALVVRMGMRPRALLGSHLIELGALAGLAVVTGVICGVTVAGVSVRRFDPARWLAPRSELPNLTPFVASVIVAGALIVALAGWIAVRSVRTARTAELLRA